MYMKSITIIVILSKNSYYVFNNFVFTFFIRSTIADTGAI